MEIATSKIIRLYRCGICKHVAHNMTIDWINENHRVKHGLDTIAVAPEILSEKTLSKIRRKKLRRAEAARKKMLLEQKRNRIKTTQRFEARMAQAIGRLGAQLKAADFFTSDAWRLLRYRALQTYGRVCAACGNRSGQMHVDHIKPRARFPELALEFSNLQILCEACNRGKSDWDETDWRLRSS